jgi:twin-arginine translocation protein, tatA/E family subunit
MKVFKKEVKELRDEDNDEKPAAQIQQQPQEGTYYTEPTQSGQTAQNTEGSSQK